MRYKYDPPLIIKKMFNDFIWESSNNKILLTFDDGPNPDSTQMILDQLNVYNIHAVFFCVGNNIKKYPNIAKDILANGHLIANHTFNHKRITKLSATETEAEISSFNKITEEELGIIPQYFRPPFGRFNLGLKNILSKYNLKNVMWSLLPYDYKNDINIVKYSVANYLRNNSIVCLHDSNKSKSIICDAIKLIVQKSNNAGFEFGEPQECLK